jgi:hypothetical protein
MQKLFCAIALSIVVLTVGATPPNSPPPSASSPKADVFTPLAVSASTPRTFAFSGTDGRTHLVYELLLTNSNVTPATLASTRSLSS